MAKLGYSSRSQAAALRGMCQQDVLFFINTFCWTVNPMWHPNCPERPFITHEFQEHAIRRMISSLARAGKPEHVGKGITQFFGRKWLTSGWIGRILPQDIGKRVYLIDNLLQVENDSQRQQREV